MWHQMCFEKFYLAVKGLITFLTPEISFRCLWITFRQCLSNSKLGIKLNEWHKKLWTRRQVENAGDGWVRKLMDGWSKRMDGRAKMLDEKQVNAHARQI